jgi:hypothetical protein
LSSSRLNAAGPMPCSFATRLEASRCVLIKTEP